MEIINLVSVLAAEQAHSLVAILAYTCVILATPLPDKHESNHEK
jgi:hypothetical protein